MMFISVFLRVRHVREGEGGKREHGLGVYPKGHPKECPKGHPKGIAKTRDLLLIQWKCYLSASGTPFRGKCRPQ